jgi:hypothetical protein
MNTGWYWAIGVAITVTVAAVTAMGRWAAAYPEMFKERLPGMGRLMWTFIFASSAWTFGAWGALSEYVKLVPLDHRPPIDGTLGLFAGPPWLLVGPMFIIGIFNEFLFEDIADARLKKEREVREAAARAAATGNPPRPGS